MRLVKGKSGVTGEVFKLLLAIIIVAAILGMLAVFFSEVRVSGETSIGATADALENFSQKIANRTAGF